MAEGWGATDPHDRTLTHDPEEGVQPLCGPTPDSTPSVQRPCRATTTGVKEAVQSALLCSADSRLGSGATVSPRTPSHTEFELLATTSSSSQLADGDISALSSTGQATHSNCGVPAPLLQASHSPICDPGGSIVLRQNTQDRKSPLFTTLSIDSRSPPGG